MARFDDTVLQFHPPDRLRCGSKKLYYPRTAVHPLSERNTLVLMSAKNLTDWTVEFLEHPDPQKHAKQSQENNL